MLRLLIVFGVFLSNLNLEICAQRTPLSTSEDIILVEPSIKESFLFFQPAYEYYQWSIFKGESNSFSYCFNFRMEDELTTVSSYKLFREVTYFDLNLSYDLFNFLSIAIKFQNILNFDSSAFAIEPFVDKNMVLFSHEADFTINACVIFKIN